MKKVLVACGAGVATSTVIVNRVKELSEEIGIQVSITQVKIVEVADIANDYDLLVSSTRIPSSVTIPSVVALNYITGINMEQTDQDIIQKLQSNI